MKKLLILVLLVCSSMYSFAQSEVTKLKQTINAEKRTVQQLFNKRDNLITSYQIVAKDYIATNAKKDSLSQKPNSPAYKNAVKKSEKLLKERNELLESIEQIKQEIDSINLVITDQELKLQQLQSQKADAKKDKKTEKGNVAKQKNEKTEKQSGKKEKIVTDEKPVRQDKRIEEVNTLETEEETRTEKVPDIIYEEPSEKDDLPEDVSEEDSKGSNSSNDNNDSFFSKLLSKIWKFIKICLWVIGGIILIVILKAMGGGKSTSRSTSSRSASDIYKDGQKRFIAGHESNISRLKVDLERAKAQYDRTKDKTDKKRIDRIKIQIAEEKRKIQDLKSTLRN